MKIKNLLPTNCPSCNTLLIWSDSGVDLICPNPDCYQKNLYKVEHFILSHDIEFITAKTLEMIGIETIEDLFDLEEFELIEMDGVGPKKARIILSQIKKSLDTTPDKLLKSFGIEGIGNSLSKDILNKWTFDQLFDITPQEFETLDGIGSVLARNLILGLGENIELYEFLQERGLKLNEVKDSNIKGMIFTLTGKSDIKRNDLTKMINEMGAQVKGISKKVNILVTNDIKSTSGKMKKALKYGTEIISYEDLYEMLNIDTTLL